MANYKKYAENLIGDWQTDQFEPQRQVAMDTYNTNWKSLTDDFENLKDKLNENISKARTTYAETLGDVQESSYSRMNNALSSLASKGLADSGIANRVLESDITQKGEDVNKALETLLSVTSEGVSGLADANNKLAGNQNKLNSGLADTLGDIGDAEAANAQQYAGLVGSVAEGAAARAASRSGSKDEDEEDELARRMRIYDLMSSEDYNDEEKARMLVNYFDYDIKTARNAVKVYTDNIKYDDLTTKLEGATKRANTLNSISKFTNSRSTINPINEIINLFSDVANKNVGKITKERNDLKVSDLYNALYGDNNYFDVRNRR